MTNYLHIRDFMIYPIDTSYSSSDLVFDVSFYNDKIILVGVEFLETEAPTRYSYTIDKNTTTVKFTDEDFNFRKPEIIEDLIYIFRDYSGNPVKIVVDENDMLVRQLKQIEI